MEPKKEKTTGGVVGILIILVVILIGGYYFSSQKIQTAGNEKISPPETNTSAISNAIKELNATTTSNF